MAFEYSEALSTKADQKTHVQHLEKIWNRKLIITLSERENSIKNKNDKQKKKNASKKME